MPEVLYLRLIILVHVSFATLFFFIYRQQRTKFGAYLTLSWAIEAIRAGINLHNLGVVGLSSYDWYALSDMLQVIANWFLFIGFVDLAKAHLPRRLGPWYIGISLPLIIVNRYLTPRLLLEWGVTPDRCMFLGVFFNQVLQFGAVAVVRLTILYWLAKIWRTERLPGALVAAIFCVPYALVSMAYPFQYYFGYNPSWVTALWLVRVQGFSVGLVMLLLNKQLLALEKSEAGLMAAQATAKLGSWEILYSDNVTHWSAEMYRMVGRDPAAGAATLAEFTAMVHAGDRAIFEQLHASAFHSPQQQKAEFRLIRPDGRMIWVEAKTECVHMVLDQPFSQRGTLQDITDKKNLEEQFLHSQRMEAVGTLASGLAHDLNNILTPMLLTADLLRDKLPDPADRAILSTVEAGARRGASIINQLLAFGRGLDGVRVDLQLRSMIGELEHLIRETFPREIEIQTNLPPDLWAIQADTTQIHQVFMNLCVNARDAMPLGGKLLISADNVQPTDKPWQIHADAKPGPYVVIAVTDTGSGIPPAIINRIFDPFFTTKPVGKGTGLGLSTAIGIIRGHGGFIDVRSEPGEGTTFRVYLPSLGTNEMVEQPASSPPFTPGDGQLILVVDDEPGILSATSGILTKYNYRVLTAVSETDAIQLYAEHSEDIELLLTDIMMPGIGGVKLIRSLRAVNPDLKVVACSGLDQDDKRTELAALGVVTLLAKPFTPEDLLKTVRKALTRQPEPSS